MKSVYVSLHGKCPVTISEDAKIKTVILSATGSNIDPKTDF